jgi:outer membrane protein OmpA-like peptidoglycan-associated protein
MRWVVALGLAALLAGCATGSTVTLLNDEGKATSGAVAVLDAKTEAERGEMASANTTADVGGRAVKAKAAKADRRRENVVAWTPYKPRVYVMYFYEGGTDLTEESIPVLDALRKAVTAESEVQITGHTDTVGDAASNDRLSLARATEVRTALVQAGLPFGNSKVVGRGERELRVATPDDTEEPANRRVEVVVR